MTFRQIKLGLTALFLSSSIGVCSDVQGASTGFEKLDRVGIGTAWAEGYDGHGLAIAVLDTLVDPTTSAISGKVVLQACFSLEDSNVGARSLCSGGKKFPDYEVVAELPIPSIECKALGCTHGTNLAVVAAGNEMSLQRVSGVAKGAEVVAAQIFSLSTSCVTGALNCDATVVSYTTSLIRALEWVHARVLEQKSTQVGPEIAAVIIGSGSGSFEQPCNDNNPLLTRQIQSLLADDIAVFAPAGNDGLCGSHIFASLYQRGACNRISRQQRAHCGFFESEQVDSTFGRAGSGYTDHAGRQNHPSERNVSGRVPTRRSDLS
jgi:hypothetical protein